MVKPYARPVGYIRVSHEDEGDNARSLEEQQAGQVAAVQTLAKRGGYQGDPVIFEDWDRSADPKKEHRRTGFNAMLAAVERGEVSAIYARSLDRLYRSITTFTRLTTAAEKYGVRVETEREGVLGGDGSPMAVAFAQITAVFANLELNTAKARAQSRVRRQREAGYRFGQAPYGELPGEDVGAIVEAFKEAGGYNGAVRLLNERDIRSRRSHLTTAEGAPLGWSPRTIRSVLLRVAPELVPLNARKGSRTIAQHLFSRLLICPHDNSVMTTIPRRDASTAYVCRLGHRAAKGTHPRPWVIGERRLTGWAKAETAAILGHAQLVQQANGTDASLTDLRARLSRFAELYGDGDITKDRYDQVKAEIEAEVARLEGMQRATITFRMGLDWSAPAGELNTRLRELWAGVRLGYGPKAKGTPRMPAGPFERDMDLVPLGAIWRVMPILDEDEDGNGIPDPAAERVPDGWFLPTAGALSEAGQTESARVARVPSQRARK
jgi:DNA invertase Pin-like site-specific DNA recombinase